LRDFFSLDGIKRNVKAQEEILVSLDLPSDAKTLRASYQKFRVREAWDFPELAVAASARMDGDRIEELSLVANAVASIPLWMDEVAAKHIGKTLDDETIEAISDDMFKASKPVRATLLPPGYRKQMVRVMTARAMREIRGDEIAEPIPGHAA